MAKFIKLVVKKLLGWTKVDEGSNEGDQEIDPLRLVNGQIQVTKKLMG